MFISRRTNLVIDKFVTELVKCQEQHQIISNYRVYGNATRYKRQLFGAFGVEIAITGLLLKTRLEKKMSGKERGGPRRPGSSAGIKRSLKEKPLSFGSNGSDVKPSLPVCLVRLASAWRRIACCCCCFSFFLNSSYKMSVTMRDVVGGESLPKSIGPKEITDVSE